MTLRLLTNRFLIRRNTQLQDTIRKSISGLFLGNFAQLWLTFILGDAREIRIPVPYGEVAGWYLQMVQTF